MVERLELIEGICHVRHRGEHTLVEAVAVVKKAIRYCRARQISKLLFDGRGFVGLAIPSVVDRFLIAEEWALEARSRVTVGLVLDSRYIHPQKFGVTAATHFGLTADVYESETAALQWLSTLPSPVQPCPTCGAEFFVAESGSYIAYALKTGEHRDGTYMDNACPFCSCAISLEPHPASRR